MELLLLNVRPRWIQEYFLFFLFVFRQKWGPAPLGASKRALPQKFGADIQIYSKKCPTKLNFAIFLSQKVNFWSISGSDIFYF